MAKRKPTPKQNGNGHWRNRIVGYGSSAPDQLLGNEANWRVHPNAQRQALSGAMHDLGIVQNVIVNKRTSEQWENGSRGVETVVDGHLRVSLAISEGQPSIPITYVDLTPAEERLALATIDPLSAMAVADKEQLDALLREVNTDSAALQAMLADVASRVFLPGAGDWGDAMGGLPDSDRAPFQQMTFTLHDSQVEMVKIALSKAKNGGAFTDSPNENSNGNALARICESYVG